MRMMIVAVVEDGVVVKDEYEGLINMMFDKAGCDWWIRWRLMNMKDDYDNGR